MKILTIGSAMRDIFVEYKNCRTVELDNDKVKKKYIVLPEDQKVEVDAIAYYTGGGAVNSAISFKKLGFDAELFCKTGSDNEGDFIINHMRSNKIITKNIIRTDQNSTGASIILPCPSGKRSVLVYRGANLTLSEEEISFDAIDNADQLYITSLSKNASKVLPIITQYAKENGKHVSINPGTSQLTANVKTLEQSLPNIDILILNLHEATLLMQSLTKEIIKKQYPQHADINLPILLREQIQCGSTRFALQHYFDSIHSMGPKIAVVTNGADGVYVSNNENIYFHPSVPGKIVSTIGSGDAFGSTFVASLAQKQPLENAIRAGIINASSVLQHLDTQTGLLNSESLEPKIKKMDKQLLQKFNN